MDDALFDLKLIILEFDLSLIQSCSDLREQVQNYGLADHGAQDEPHDKEVLEEFCDRNRDQDKR